MKKLIKFMFAALFTAVMFMSCGNPAETAPEQDDGVTVEQFIEKLIDFNEGITADGQFRITFETEGWMFYKKNGTDWEAFDTKQLASYAKLSKKSNLIFAYEEALFYFTLSNNLLSIKYYEEFCDFFGNQPDNTVILYKK